jgi:hypothetical protein
VGEHYLDTVGVRSSILLVPTKERPVVDETPAVVGFGQNGA